MMHGFQQIVTQTERRDNFVVHGLPPLGDEMGVSPLLWRKKLMDSISSNLGYIIVLTPSVSYLCRYYRPEEPYKLARGDAVMRLLTRAEGGLVCLLRRTLPSTNSTLSTI